MSAKPYDARTLAMVRRLLREDAAEWRRVAGLSDVLEGSKRDCLARAAAIDGALQVVEWHAADARKAARRVKP